MRAEGPGQEAAATVQVGHVKLTCLDMGGERRGIEGRTTSEPHLGPGPCILLGPGPCILLGPSAAPWGALTLAEAFPGLGDQQPLSAA